MPSRPLWQGRSQTSYGPSSNETDGVSAMDTLGRKHRSWNMSQIKSRNTKPELVVRSLLHRAGYRFRLHCRGLPGSPDIVLPKYRTIILVHGCCKFTYAPKSNLAFWRNKFRNNIQRDRIVIRRLRTLGWHVLVVWECQVANAERLLEMLTTLLSQRPLAAAFHLEAESRAVRTRL